MYVIQNTRTVTLPTSDKSVTYVSYFVKCGLFGMCTFSNLGEAKRYKNKRDAKLEMEKLFEGDTSKTIVKIDLNK